LVVIKPMSLIPKDLLPEQAEETTDS